MIGDETRKQMKKIEGRLPDSLVACIGGGSNAMGLFIRSSTIPPSRFSVSRPPATA